MMVQIKKLDPNAVTPARSTREASGFDLRITEYVNVEPNQIVRAKTGIAISFPKGYDCQMRPRSSLSSAGVHVSLGTIDSDYRGELKVIIHNTTDQPVYFKEGSKIAQLVFTKLEPVFFAECDELDETARGFGGFGSTGG